MKIMDIYDFVENIKTKGDFESFMSMLIKDLRENRGDWENNELEPFLDGIKRFTEVLDNYYSNARIEADTSIPTWKMFAEVLLAAKVYE